MTRAARRRIGSRDNRERAVTPHSPERRCLGCGRCAPKSTLMRFVALPAAGGGRDLVHDVTGRAGGRGLYVCPNSGCFDRAVARGAFRRSARLRGEPLHIDAALAAATGMGEGLRG